MTKHQPASAARRLPTLSPSSFHRLAGEILFARPVDIPEYVATGAADLGITGHDMVTERNSDVEEFFRKLKSDVRRPKPGEDSIAAALPWFEVFCGLLLVADQELDTLGRVIPEVKATYGLKICFSVGLLSGGWKWQGGLGLPLPKPVTPLVIPVRPVLGTTRSVRGPGRLESLVTPQSRLGDFLRRPSSGWLC